MFKICIFFVTVLVAAAWCLPTADEDSSVPVGDCEYKGLVIKQGETVPAPIGECNIITCHSPEYISMLTCAEFIPAPGCHKSENDLTKPYPECCPKSVCDH